MLCVARIKATAPHGATFHKGRWCKCGTPNEKTLELFVVKAANIILNNYCKDRNNEYSQEKAAARTQKRKAINIAAPPAKVCAQIMHCTVLLRTTCFCCVSSHFLG